MITPWKNYVRFCKSLLIYLVTLIILPSIALSEETYRFERMWPALKQPWYFFYPEGVAVGPDGNVYVADSDNHRIQKFTPDGTFITNWGSRAPEDRDPEDGEFYDPGGIAVGPDGNIYVADTWNYRIQKFTPDGTFITKWGSEGDVNGDFKEPIGIVVDPGGNVYVADGGNNRIQVFDSSGTFLKKWGTKGSGDGGFEGPAGIALDPEGNVYVTDGGNHRVQKFTSDGTFITKWGNYCDFRESPESLAECVDPDGAGPLELGDGEFSGPHGIVVDSEKNVYVVDIENNRVQKFTSDGTFITKWNTADKDAPEFHPVGIALDPEGNVYVADTGNHRIQKFTSNGDFITKWGSEGDDQGKFHWPYGIAAGPDGNVYVADTYNDRIQKFDSDGAFITEWGGEGSEAGKFYYPKGIAVSPDGNVYVADLGNDRIQKFTPSGTPITKWGGSGYGDGEFANPGGIAVGPDGNVYVVDSYNDRVQKFDSNGIFITKWGSTCYLLTGDGCEDPDGAGPLELGDGDFREPSDIAVGPDGNVYVADTYNYRIQIFTSDGTFVTKWRTEDNPGGIGVDAEGDVYVPDANSNLIRKFTSDGTNITQWGNRGAGPGQTHEPYDIAVSSESGKAYVTDKFNNRVQVFKKADTLPNARAIIVAGRQSSADSLWGATQVCTNFAYRALTYQGYTDDDIHYLAADTDLDINGDGVADVDGEATITHLKSAITEWTVNEGADSLVLYLNDHGGPDTFRLSETETLSASTLSSWFDELETNISDKIIVVYEACESGSFVDDLEGNDRIIITSTLPGEQAKFLSQGIISFSSFFWTHIFNGLSIEEAYTHASQVVNFAFNNQNPQLSGEAEGVYIGNGVGNMIGKAPEIGSVSPPREIDDTTSAELYADDVANVDGIARVWAVIWSPDYSGTSVDPLLSLPTFGLAPVGGDRYEGTYSDFTSDGTYQVAIYAMDSNNNTSIPKVTTVSRNYHVSRKALIVAGDESESLTREMIEKNAELAYNALKSQLFDDGDIYFMSVTGIEGFDVSPSLFYLETYLNSLILDINTETLDLTIYLVGDGDEGTFKLNDSETLTVSVLDGWLDTLQDVKPGRVTFVYEAFKSGSFIPLMTPPVDNERVLITSTGEEGESCPSSWYIFVSLGKEVLLSVSMAYIFIL